MSGFEDDDHTRFFRLEGTEGPDGQEKVLSAAAFTLSAAALTNSVTEGTPGFVSDEYLGAIAAETTLTAMEHDTASDWERVDGGYRITDQKMVDWVVSLHRDHEWDLSPEECPKHQMSATVKDTCRLCGAPLDARDPKWPRWWFEDEPAGE